MSVYRWIIALKPKGYAFAEGFKTKAEAKRAMKSAVKQFRKNNVRMDYGDIIRLPHDSEEEKGKD